MICHLESAHFASTFVKAYHVFWATDHDSEVTQYMWFKQVVLRGNIAKISG